MESDKSGGWDGCIHTTIYKINSKDLLYGTGGYVHYRAITYDGKGSEKECIYIYIFSPEHSTEAQMPYICVYTHTHTHTHTHTFLLSCFSCVQFFATLCTITCQAPLFMGFSRQEYWSGLPFPSPGDLPHPGIEPGLSGVIND